MHTWLLYNTYNIGACASIEPRKATSILAHTHAYRPRPTASVNHNFHICIFVQDALWKFTRKNQAGKGTIISQGPYTAV